MKTKKLAVLIAIASVLVFSAATLQEQKKSAGYENLKVLPKNISSDELDSIMGTFSLSLGVKCSFCHLPSTDTVNRHLDFASDKKKEKQIARDMYAMTAEINAKFFNHNNTSRPDTIHEIVCYTCHRGSKSPDAEDFIALIDSTMKGWKKARQK
jgi:hypothetical protein